MTTMDDSAYDRPEVLHDVTEHTADRTPETTPGTRLGTLVWGVIALLVAVWSLSTVLMEWTVDPALVGIVLAGAVGVALIGGGITGAARRRDHP